MEGALAFAITFSDDLLHSHWVTSSVPYPQDFPLPLLSPLNAIARQITHHSFQRFMSLNDDVRQEEERAVVLFLCLPR